MPKKSEKIYRVTGTVIDAKTGRGLPKLRVEAWDKDAIFDDQLGQATTDTDGKFTIQFDETRFNDFSLDRGLDLFFKVYRGKTLLKSTEEDVLWNIKEPDTSVRIEVDLAASDDQPTAPPATFVVIGKVISRVSAGVGGLRVQVVDKNVGSDLALGEATTDSYGQYKVSFSDVELKRHGKEKPDLQARVFAGKQFLTASEVRYNASAQEKDLNVLLDDKTLTNLVSEHEALISALSVHYGGSLGNLQETDERQDITYLANKSGWDARAVALAALAEQFAEKTAANGSEPIEPAFFYALFRSGLPANETTIYQTDLKIVEGIWNQALKQGIIPAGLRDHMPKALEQFQQKANQQFLEGPVLVGVSSLKDILELSLSDSRQREQVADLYTRHGNDTTVFWEQVQEAFGEATTSRLKVNGQLAYLTLNNAPLINKLHTTVGENNLRDSLDLVAQGLYRAAKWRETIGSDPIPSNIPGRDDAEKRTRYAELLAAQVRLSFPTATVAEMVMAGETPTSSRDVQNGVHAFLTEHQGKFEIGMQPVAQYIARNKLDDVPPAVTREITRIQRVYQITPDDESMNTLLKKEIDSSYAVVRYDRDEFVRAFKDDLGGEQNARLIHAKAQQVHSAVLNIALTFLAARSAPGIGVHSPPSIIDPASVPSNNADDILAYGTLENIFGEMDYCTCDHCKSILSPAAYLVDLLLFLEPAGWSEFVAHWRTEHGTAPYPFANIEAWNNAGSLTNTEITPQQVLLSRRPDIQHLPLTCENTNTPMPYIDLVNETLEYYITNGRSLTDTNPAPNINTEYTGHNTDSSIQPEELLASPQFVSDTAYTTLAGDNFPPPLPFHRPLENLRRYFRRFEAPLSEVMEALRKDDSLNRASATEYGWRDIWMETLGLSRVEYRLLTERWLTGGVTEVMLTVKLLYGFDPGAADGDVRAVLDNAKLFSRRVGITYEELVEIIKTQFVNPNSYLIPKLERLGVPFAALKALKDATITDAEFDALLAPGLDIAQYDDGVKGWVRDNDNYSRIMSLLTLTNPADPEEVCDFDKVELRYSNPDMDTNQFRAFEFIRIIRFIRLWKKLGWTIEQTDKAISALYPADQVPNDPSEIVNLERLDAGFLALLPSLGVVQRVIDLLKLSPKKDLLPLLACIAPIDTHGERSFYRQIFLSPAQLDNAFAEDSYGNYLIDTTQKVFGHIATLRAAFSLTASEFNEIVSALDYDTNTELSIDNISAIFRRGWLARKLKLSVREFLLLTKFTGYNPFEIPNPTGPAILHLLELIGRLRTLGIKPAQALYLIWNQDLSGKSTPADAEIVAFARTLRTSLTAIDAEFARVDDPDGSIARARMSLVYSNDAANLFFGLLGDAIYTVVPYTHTHATLEQPILDVLPNRIAYDNINHKLSFEGAMAVSTREAFKAVVGVAPEFKAAVDALFVTNQTNIAKAVPQHITEMSYSHNQSTLEQPILDTASGQINYNDFRKKLSFAGVLSTSTVTTLKDIAGVTQDFKNAVDALYTENHEIIDPFFERYPELLLPYGAYMASADPIETKRTTLLNAFLPQLKHRRKQQQALQSISAEIEVDIGLASSLLKDKAVLHAAGDVARPALDDLTAVDSLGLSVQYFYNTTGTGNPDLVRNAEAPLAYADSGANRLPTNTTTPGGAISGFWSGYLDAPENGFYNLRVDTEDTATVTLMLNETAVALTQAGNRWSNSAPIELLAGSLYKISLKVKNVKDELVVRWQTAGHGWENIPASYLYSKTLVDNLRRAYISLLKATKLAESLKLTTLELVHFAAAYQISTDGWLNHLPLDGSPDTATSAGLLKAFVAILNFSRIKAEISSGDERLLQVLKNPAAATASADGLLYILTRWEKPSVDAFLLRFGKVATNLSDMETLHQLYDAYGWAKKLGVPAQALIDATTNEPTVAVVRNLQAALRARYEQNAWLEVLRPINDEMRSLQRDALVAYVLHHMRSDPASAHIDTPEKLFEYFLMDVQMDPCMLTSRIRHALSSVQLFIERSLMNLERRVASASINAKQWEWMKRYRVWEANRKVFLWPENWLEPELRDDQSPFFKETMSELLQGDITEDRAAEALVGYLTKLEEVAKLEVCGIYYEQNKPGTADDIAHVIARTAGARRTYYYRRREGGSWTPWEKMNLDIEDNPVLPVVWKNRLFLFWLKLIQEPEPQPPHAPSGALNTVEVSAILPTGSPKVIVKAMLSWSEFLGGKWQPSRTSDTARPLQLSDGLNPGDVNSFRSDLRLAALFWPKGSDPQAGLRIIVSYKGWKGSSFFLYNSFSTPELRDGKKETHFSPKRSFDTSTAALNISYSDTAASHAVLENSIADRTIDPHHPLDGDSWDAPFFYEDSRHVFYVTTAKNQMRLTDWTNLGIILKAPKETYNIPPLVLKPNKVQVETILRMRQPGFGVIDPSPLERYVTEDAYVGTVIGTPGTVAYGDKNIGPSGSQFKSTRTR